MSRICALHCTNGKTHKRKRILLIAYPAGRQKYEGLMRTIPNKQKKIDKKLFLKFFLKCKMRVDKRCLIWYDTTVLFELVRLEQKRRQSC